MNYKKRIKLIIVPIVLSLLLIITALTTRKTVYSVYIKAQDYYVEMKENSLAWKEAEQWVEKGKFVLWEIGDIIKQTSEEEGTLWSNLLKHLEELLSKRKA